HTEPVNAQTAEPNTPLLPSLGMGGGNHRTKSVEAVRPKNNTGLGSCKPDIADIPRSDLQSQLRCSPRGRAPGVWRHIGRQRESGEIRECCSNRIVMGLRRPRAYMSGERIIVS